MKSIEAKIGGVSSKILIGGSLDNLKHLIPSNSIIITDKNVFGLYGKRFPDFPIIQIEPGEKSKILSNIEYICSKLLRGNVDRETMLVGIGGGVVTDITGFVASIMKRGMNFAFASTTLLGQADASIGGKNGINIAGFKNVIGTINQPQFIISDISLLKTLSGKEMMNGLCEMIKTAVIGSIQLFDTIESKYENVYKYDLTTIEDLVFDTACIKTGIVEKDERESGMRRVLNFGHTFGHAIETVTGCSHGEAVGLGIRIATEISRKILNLKNEVNSKINILLTKIGVPSEFNFDKDKIFDVMINDKKRYAGKIKFVLLQDFSQPLIEELSIQELKGMFYDMR